MVRGMSERTSNMQFEMLENNIIDMIEEQQLKLGYLDETVRLYYPLSSLNRFLNTEDDEDMMTKHLEQFANEVEDRLGKIDISHKRDRFCVAVPPIGAKYVHDRLNTDGFLARFFCNRCFVLRDTKGDQCFQILRYDRILLANRELPSV